MHTYLNLHMGMYTCYMCMDIHTSVCLGDFWKAERIHKLVRGCFLGNGKGKWRQNHLCPT